MANSIEVTEELFNKVTDILNEEFKIHKIVPSILYHTNILADVAIDEFRVYLSRRIFREQQDTLCVNVTDLGRVRYQSEGVVQISFFAPRAIKNSSKILEIVAQNLKNKLRKSQFDCFWLRNITATPYNVENNSYRYEVTAIYMFDEII